MNSEELLQQCVDRWDDYDSRVSYVINHYDEWLKPMTPDVKETMLSLLENFDYYSHKKANSFFKDIHKKLQDEYEITDDDTVYTVIKSQRNSINSSYEYWVEYNKLNNVNGYSMVPDLTEEILSNGCIKNIVFLDDCSESGKTFTDYLTTILSNNPASFNGKNIFLVVLHIQEVAGKKIQEFAKDNNLTIILIFCNQRLKAFKYLDEVESRRQKVVDYSNNVKIPSSFQLGFHATESLVAFYNNTPNNTIGLFWCKTTNNQPLFPRIDRTRPGWRTMNSEKKQRLNDNYNWAKNGNG